jgi:hypothetical protein
MIVLMTISSILFQTLASSIPYSLIALLKAERLHFCPTLSALGSEF